jgi:hypothetical protein
METGKRPINVACQKSYNNGVLPVLNAYVFGNGLAVHRAIAGMDNEGQTVYHSDWTITHVQSGLTLGSWGYQLKRHAVAVVRMMTELSGVNDFSWDIPFGDVSGNRDQIVAMYDIVQSARRKLEEQTKVGSYLRR